jgi:2-polyprenyl-6-methoxyphenol hydroxylase-like FAD-dependent oxidoreductase
MPILNTQCCIVGGGPAGMILGLLLARAGIDVTVLEKHADFLRDFRGDTIHSSTLQLMHELGMLADFLKQPHQEVSEMQARIGQRDYRVADFSHLPCQCKFIALMPQWDFLNFLTDRAKTCPGFHLQMESNAEDLIHSNGRCAGVRAATPSGPLQVNASLVVGADGRHSTVRARAGLETLDLGAPMDVLWFRVRRNGDQTAQALGRISAGRMIVMINRGDYWQCGFVIRKGGFDQIRERGLEAFRSDAVRLMGIAALGEDELRDWNEVKLLTVVVDRLRQWHMPGLLCIGDAAHAMSPIGGVGINLAVQDAVAAANILGPHLAKGHIDDNLLHEVQTRRERAVRSTQSIQLWIQKRVISNVLERDTEPRAPFILKLLNRIPPMRRLPARLIGLGFQPEHVRTPQAP